MAVVKMSKMRLTALSSEKDEILNALQVTDSVHLKPMESETMPASNSADTVSEVQSKQSRVDSCIEFLTEMLDEYLKEADYSAYCEKIKQVRRPVELSHEDFFEIKNREGELTEKIECVEKNMETISSLKVEKNRLTNLTAQILSYNCLKEKFSLFKDTENTVTVLGQIEDSLIVRLKKEIGELGLAQVEELGRTSKAVVMIVAHKSVKEQLDGILAEIAFVKCPYAFDCTPEEKLKEINNELKELKGKQLKAYKDTCAFADDIRNFKILSDYYSFIREKENAAGGFYKTASTFTFEGYLPEENIENVERAIEKVTKAVVTDYKEPEKDETPPTLCKNSQPFAAAEFVTDMYSSPDYREIDPNKLVFIFFMMFFGIIMSDIGYGLVLFVIGLAMSAGKKYRYGTGRLMRVIMYGGIFTAIFGALFGSFFGFSLYSFLPDPTSGSSTAVMTILLGCLALGLLQIAVGYAMNAANSIKKGDILGAIFDSFSWVLFCVGLFFAVFNFITDYFSIPVSAGVGKFFDAAFLPGLIMTALGLLTAMLTAGRKEKLLGKFTKGFGAAYGIINLLSDVLSYARLFGLMLSGMIVAQQFNSMGLQIAALGEGDVISQILSAIPGGLIIVIGHIFNLGMGVLGAYIHDCRLQYIEFFSKFYTGEGEPFTPLGRDRKYVNFNK